jgi:hypothetical protein
MSARAIPPVHPERRERQTGSPDDGIDYSEIPDMGEDEAFWATARLGPVVVSARTAEALQEEVLELRRALAAVVQALDTESQPAVGAPKTDPRLAAALDRARELLARTPVPG